MKKNRNFGVVDFVYGPVWTLYGPWKDLALKLNSIPWSVIAATLDKGILEKCFIISIQGPYMSLQIFFIPTRRYFNRNLLYGPYSLKLKMMISRLGSKISKNVPGIFRVIHRDASIAKFFFYTKKWNMNKKSYTYK